MSATALREATYSAFVSPSAERSGVRIASVDIVRGLAVVLMAIDHVRVYAGQPPGGPTYGIFFTRWITHFVAPAFVFLAGTAAYLHGRRLGDRGALARFLVTRGLWLVALELTVIRVTWTFNFDFSNYLLAGVIWMLGWCMVLMAAVIYLPRAVVIVGSLAIIAGHNVTDFIPGFRDAISSGTLGWLGKVLYAGGGLPGEYGPMFVLFVIVPWIGVMAAGYAFGPVLSLPRERRRAVCWRIGIAAIVAFIGLRALDSYGDPRHWRERPPVAASTAAASSVAQAAAQTPPRRPALIAFLDTTKYPASLSFLLMTLGPMFVLLALADGARNPIARMLETFGRVPMFYYLLHIPLIHLAAIVVSLARSGAVTPWLFENHPVFVGPPPPGSRWSLPMLYLVWLIVTGVLYVACRWYAGFKARRRSVWLSYL